LLGGAEDTHLHFTAVGLHCKQTVNITASQHHHNDLKNSCNSSVIKHRRTDRQTHTSNTTINVNEDNINQISKLVSNKFKQETFNNERVDKFN